MKQKRKAKGEKCNTTSTKKIDKTTHFTTAECKQNVT